MTLSAPPDSARANGPRASNLTLRVASAVVLAPVTLAITYVGGWIFDALCAIAAGGILWEWVSLASHRADLRVLAPGWLALLGATVLIGLALPAGGIGAVAIGAIVAGSIVAALPRATDEPSAPAWAAGGVFYAGALLIAPAMLRSDPQWGLMALLFLFANVWATDIFAYFCGRAIGGPLLWPRVSPRRPGPAPSAVSPGGLPRASRSLMRAGSASWGSLG